MSDDTHPAYLDPSELGTKDYWETFYKRTLSHLSSKTTPAHPAPENETEHTDNESTDNEESEGEDTDSDPGTTWFSEHNAPQKVLAFLTDSSFPLAPCNTIPPSSTTTSKLKAKSNTKTKPKPRSKNDPPTTHELTTQPSILDLGTGNGSMLAMLRRKGGFRGMLVGVDYSEGSVRLARELVGGGYYSFDSDGSDEGDYGEDGDGDGEEDDVVIASPTSTTTNNGDARGDEEGEGLKTTDLPNTTHASGIRFEVWDILSSTHHLYTSSSSSLSQIPEEEKLPWFPYHKGGFDIVHDKGTFDAVSLSSETDSAGKRVCERYPAIAKGLVRKGGFLVVTSCNWTEEELVRWFVKDGDGDGDGDRDGLRVWGRVEYPRFRFGGREGQGVCTVCFVRD